jgi:SRSO17 transposase
LEQAANSTDISRVTKSGHLTRSQQPVTGLSSYRFCITLGFGGVCAVSRSAGFGDDLDGWVTPFLDAMGRSTRRRWAPVYLRGLLGPDGPKSVQPIATRLGLRGHDQLHRFVTSPAWNDAPLWRVLAEKADAIVGGDEAVLVIDDPALPKKGTRSVGLAPQYCGELGKQANCQALVSLTLARGEVPVPIGLWLFLPKSWTDDPARRAAAGVPETARMAQTKPEIAVDEIDRVRAAGIRFGCGLADAGYGLSAPFRRGLSARGLVWSVGIPRTQTVFTTGVGLRFSRAGRGKPRQHAVPSEDARSAADLLAGGRWRRIAWRQGSKGPLAARFAALRVRVADGPRSPRHGHCPAKRFGWSANGAAAASANTTSATSRRARRCCASPQLSRHGGSASRPTNN